MIPSLSSKARDTERSLRWTGADESRPGRLTDSFNKDMTEFRSKPKDHEPQTYFKRVMTYLVYDQTVEMMTGLIIVANFIVICMETDARSQLLDAPKDSKLHEEAEGMITRLTFVNIGFLVFYGLEYLMRLYVQRMKYYNNIWNCFDFTVLVSGVVGEILSAFTVSDNIFGTQLLRILRMIRLLRVSRVLISFPALYRLITGLFTCMKTLLWAAGLIFMMLSAWSIIAVEYIHPLMEDLDQLGYYDSCHWCPGAFRSIMHSNLTFFQIMSGDGWSLLTRAVIERHPWTAVIFAGVIFSMVFGLLNLMTAVVVDTAVAAREKDVTVLAASKQEERDTAWKCFADLCIALDEDNSGALDMDELKKGLKTNDELRTHLTVMGIEEGDLSTLFDILDEDGNGELSTDEFKFQLYRIKTMETSTTTFFMKTYIDEMLKLLRDVSDQSHKLFERSNFDKINRLTESPSNVEGTLDDTPLNSSPSLIPPLSTSPSVIPPLNNSSSLTVNTSQSLIQQSVPCTAPIDSSPSLIQQPAQWTSEQVAEHANSKCQADEGLEKPHQDDVLRERERINGAAMGTVRWSAR
eukprot:gnl/MRDRNA2_/MRDRNA2_80179_c0_seq1.p1 gnl/MRDRNA2_/MRDRNA2_80179_c0~~gnl/MRDRNA2_/MRDRNA2_80179_c0_seq1.p1  ORF type:complete len:578 (+),score=62.18 gnl/MRDRNA2_/MRDRNA2_80179_c0_seq1:180-1913(+)